MAAADRFIVSSPAGPEREPHDSTAPSCGLADATVFAVASGAGRTAIAVVRISGPATAAVLGRIANGLPVARRASLRTLHDPATGEALDRALVLWMPGLASFTGEDTAELHVHGGLAVRSAVLALLAREGCRAAEPGEFTRRAFRNGRLDLTAVEGLADLIEAETEGQRRQALRQADGHLARRVGGWRDRLMDALALCEAELDFSDEGDVEADVARPALATVAAVRLEMAEALAGASRGERVREGFTVVIAGRPNAGKSTLLNALARRDVAIVSALPGTTRDAIEVRCDVDGMAVTLVDTAGLRESADPLEQEGMARARARAEAADLVLWLTPADEPDPQPEAHPGTTSVLLVRTKADVLSCRSDPASLARNHHPLRRHAEERPEAASRSTLDGRASFETPASQAPQDDAGGGLAGVRGGLGGLLVSATTGQGLSDLLAAIGTALSAQSEGAGDAVLTRVRHREVLSDAAAALERAAIPGLATELVAEDLRLALRALGRMTGAVDVEDVLDRVFASFCIGK